MSYTALYRRFRPQLFAELVGQEHISRTLAAAIRQGSFVHAYLLCGPRGTGKTSTARIMARAVNCLNPTAQGEPCGLCAACQRSLQGEAIDILEIDAASNRGIDEIRDLRERVKYAPALEKYKVYIIDEVHMLTAPAFNALLKTLEEPPPQVLFILATTEPHKLPLTVLSRCQRFDFRRIADAELTAHLAQVAQAEGYTAEPQALALIARKAEGGMRDALGLLDQCAGFNNGSITVPVLNKLTGAVDADFIEEITHHMLAGDAATLLAMVAQLHEAGRDLRQFLHDLLEYQRELLLTRLSTQGTPALPGWAAQAEPNRLIRLMQSLSDGDGRLRNSLQPRLTLELALLNACESGGQKQEAKIQKKDEKPAEKPQQAVAPQQMAGQKPAVDPPKQEIPVQQGPAQQAVAKPAKPQPAPAQQAAANTAKSQPAPAQQAAANPAKPQPAMTAVEQPAPAQQAAAAPADNSADTEQERLQQMWPHIVKEVDHANPSIGALLKQAQPQRLSKNTLTLLFPAGFAMFMKQLCGPGAARGLLQQRIETVFGRKLGIEGVLAQAEEEPPPPTEAPPEEEQTSLF